MKCIIILHLLIFLAEPVERFGYIFTIPTGMPSICLINITFYYLKVNQLKGSESKMRIKKHNNGNSLLKKFYFIIQFLHMRQH